MAILEDNEPLRRLQPSTTRMMGESEEREAEYGQRWNRRMVRQEKREEESRRRHR